MTKKELIKEMESKGLNFDPKLTKKELEKIFKDNETVAVLIDDYFSVDKYEASYISKGRTFILGMYATVKDANRALDRAGAYNRKIKHINK